MPNSCHGKSFQTHLVCENTPSDDHSRGGHLILEAEFSRSDSAVF